MRAKGNQRLALLITPEVCLGSGMYHGDRRIPCRRQLGNEGGLARACMASSDLNGGPIQGSAPMRSPCLPFCPLIWARAPARHSQPSPLSRSSSRSHARGLMHACSTCTTSACWKRNTAPTRRVAPGPASTSWPRSAFQPVPRQPRTQVRFQAVRTVTPGVTSVTP